jgi:hypothetical protein
MNTDGEWREIREQARQSMPSACAGKGLPEILLPYQREIFTALEKHDVVVAEKSRRTGFTWGAGSRAVLYAAARPDAGGMDALYIGYNLEMAREFIDVCGMWAKAFSRMASAVEECVFEETDESGDRHSIKAFRITFAGGFEIVALSARPRSLRGKQGFVIIDEAAFHDDLPGLLKAALALLMWGGKVLIISTHNGEEHPFNQLCLEVQRGDKAYGHIRVDFDRALREGLYRRICLARGREWTPDGERVWRDGIVAQYGQDAEEELFCIPRSDGNVYAFIPVNTIVEAMERPLPEINAQALIIGVDVARYGPDSSVLYPRRGRDARGIPYRVYRKLSLMDLARKIVDWAMELNADMVFVDGGGVGGGVCDALKDMRFPYYTEIAFGGKSPHERYLNRRAHMYGELRDWLPTGCLPKDEALKKELAAPHYSFTGPDVVKLESKEEIKARLGLSPDIADALALTFAEPVYRFDPVREMIEAVKQSKPYDPVKRDYDYDPRRR